MQGKGNADWMAKLAAIAKATEEPISDEELDKAWANIHTGMHQIDSERQWIQLVDKVLGPQVLLKAAVELSLDRARAIGTIKMSLIASVMLRQSIAGIRPVRHFGPKQPSVEIEEAEIHDAVVETDTLGEVEIMLQEYEGRIIVSLEERPEYETNPPKVVLLKDDGEKIVEEAQQECPGDEYETVFEDVDSGRYLIAIE